MDILFVDPERRMDPAYIEAWWAAFEREESICSELGLPLPVPPTNAPGWDLESAALPLPVEETSPAEAPAPTPASGDMDPAQAAVVAHPGGPALVMAGAGSGKTRTIVARVVHLLNRGVDPRSILCLTFTRKAANEMRARIGRSVGEGVSKRIMVSTFHALALDLLRTHPAVCARNKGFSVWDDGVQKNELKSLVKQHPNAEGVERGEWVDATEIGAALDTLKEQGAEIPGKAFYRALGALDEQAWEVAVAYEELKKSCNALDFADLVWLTATRLLGPESPHRAAIKAHWAHVIVDEYQDTNAIQEMLLQALVEDHQNLMVVGDEDQAIYSFRGSNVDFIRTFPERYGGAKVYLLGRNYRSTQRIVSAANALISQNKRRNFKTVWSEGDEGAVVDAFSLSTPYEEARVLAAGLEAIRTGGTPDSEIAVLVRTRMQFIPIQMELQRRSIPFYVVGDIPWYARVDAKVILAWMRGLVNPRDLDAGAAILKSWDGLGSGTVSLWRTSMETIGDAMFSRLPFLHGRPGLGIHTKRGKRLAAFGEAWAAWVSETQEARTNGTNLRARVEALLNRIGITQEVIEGRMSGKPSEAAEALRREQFLQQILQSMPDTPGSGDWVSIQHWLDELFTSAQAAEAHEGVCLSTIHGSKGLEWDAVWLPGWSSGLFPSERAIKPTEVEEERRLAYVAATRARKWLAISWFRHSDIPQPKDHQPSVFLRELDEQGARGPEWTQALLDDEIPPVLPTLRTPSASTPTWMRPEWARDTLGELSPPWVDEDQAENGWALWGRPGEFVLQSVTLHDEERPIRCIACARSLRVSVSLAVKNGPDYPTTFRMGRRCAARLLGHRGLALDAVRAAETLGVPVIRDAEGTQGRFIQNTQPERRRIDPLALFPEPRSS